MCAKYSFESFMAITLAVIAEVGGVSKSCTQVKVFLLYYNNNDSGRSRSAHQNADFSKSKND